MMHMIPCHSINDIMISLISLYDTTILHHDTHDTIPMINIPYDTHDTHDTISDHTIPYHINDNIHDTIPYQSYHIMYHISCIIPYMIPYYSIIHIPYHTSYHIIFHITINALFQRTF